MAKISQGAWGRAREIDSGVKSKQHIRAAIIFTSQPNRLWHPIDDIAEVVFPLDVFALYILVTRNLYSTFFELRVLVYSNAIALLHQVLAPSQRPSALLRLHLQSSFERRLSIDFQQLSEGPGK